MKNKILTALFACIAASAIFGAVSASAMTRAEQSALLRKQEFATIAKLAPIADIEKIEDEQINPETLAEWWNIFNDPIMTDLIKRALANNRTLEAARARVKQARAMYRIREASNWIDAKGYWTNARTPIEAGGAGTGSQLYSLGLDASWEIDIFGGVAAKTKSKHLAVEAEYAALYGTWNTVASETAIAYISLRSLQRALEIAEYNLAVQKQTVAIQQSKVDSGLSDQLALKQATTIMERTKAGIPALESGIEQYKNAIAVLIGVIPGDLEQELDEHKPIPKIEGLKYICIPANAIRQRPDIREAERRLASQRYMVKSARANLYPKFYLTGIIGTEAIGTSDLFGGPAKWYRLLPSFTLPIFHDGAIRNNIKAQSALEEQLLAKYEATVLKAIAEVRDAIIANAKEYDRLSSLEVAYDSANEALEIANNRFANGLVDFINVITAENELLNASSQYVTSEGELAINAVKVFKALGGGWKPLEESEKVLAAAAAAEKNKKK